MNRPFTIIGSEGSYINKYYIQNHRGDSLTKKKSIVDGFFEKLLCHPITAFAYSLVDVQGVSDINPKFDRADVIKALDFCIQYFVYQNKVDYIMEGTVNKDFEVTVRELVETREAVLKEKADTKFVRKGFGNRNGNSFEFQRGLKYYRLQNNKVDTNMSKYDIDHYKLVTGLKFPKAKKLFKPVGKDVEYTEGMCDFTSNISYGSEQFCHKVITKKILARKNYEDNFRSSYTPSGSLTSMLDEMARNSSNFANAMNNNWRLVGGMHTSFDTELAGYFRVPMASEVADHRITSIDTGNMDLSGIQRWQRTGTVRCPPNTNLHVGDILQLQDAGDGRTLARGRVTEPIVSEDIITFIHGEWSKVPEPATHIRSTMYENVRLSNMNNADGDLEVWFSTEGTSIEMTIPEPSMHSFIDHVSRVLNHTIRIERRANQMLERVEVDHRVFPVRSLRIRQGHSDPLADPSQNFLGRNRALQIFLHPNETLVNRFVRMSLTETSISIGEHITQQLTFYDGARTFVKMTIQNPTESFDINNNGFNDITFPGGGMVAINGINYAVPDNRVEVVTR